MELLHQVLPLNFHPQQKSFKFDDITFSSQFDSGNLLNAIRINDTIFNLLISPDCNGLSTLNIQSYRTWFYFSISGAQGRTLTISICNMNNQMKMFADGYKIVYRKGCDEGEWRRLENEITAKVDSKEQMTITFNFQFGEDDSQIYFSFCYPWSYSQNQQFLAHIEKSIPSHIYYSREILTYSKEKRSLDLITISSFDRITSKRETNLKGLFPNKSPRPFSFSHDKPIIFLSARVHPGETPSSHIMNGILQSLTSDSDPRMKILRRFFVFKIIPMINVDGVYRGYYRLDTAGNNLNRHYASLDQKAIPEIFAVKKIFLYYSSEFKVKYYFDLHAHVMSKGLFMFGNSLDFVSHVENCMIPQVMEINCKFFNFDDCVFNEKSMKSKSRMDAFSKEGTGRVFFHKATDIIHSYTVEASYFRARKLMPVHEETSPQETLQTHRDKLIKYFKFTPHRKDVNDENDNSQADSQMMFNIKSYNKMGIGILVSVIDYEEINPFSRISIANLRKNLAQKLISSDERFKLGLQFKQMAKDIQQLKKNTSIFEQIEKQFIDGNQNKQESSVAVPSHRQLLMKYPQQHISTTRSVKINKLSLNKENEETNKNKGNYMEIKPISILKRKLTEQVRSTGVMNIAVTKRMLEKSSQMSKGQRQGKDSSSSSSKPFPVINGYSELKREIMQNKY